MTEKEFCRWLQGHFELNPDNNQLTEEQVKMIKQHLQLVFTKVTSEPYILGSPGSLTSGIFC